MNLYIMFILLYTFKEKILLHYNCIKCEHDVELKNNIYEQQYYYRLRF